MATDERWVKLRAGERILSREQVHALDALIRERNDDDRDRR